jgi:hypothetical protein
MPIYRPKSFLALVVIGFAVVATPLLLALVNAEFFMGRLADRSSEAIYRSIDVIQASRSLVDELVAMERRARQYQVLQDPELLRDLVENPRQVAADPRAPPHSSPRYQTDGSPADHSQGRGSVVRKSSLGPFEGYQGEQ